MSTSHADGPSQARKTTKKKMDGANVRPAVSENESSDFPGHNQSPARAAKGRNRTKSSARKQNTNYDSAAHSDGPNVRQHQQYQKHHATPIKNQAYAGPTFHQSPAASALPMPSFYSKSLPSAGMMKPIPSHERPATQAHATHETADPPEEVKRESTPLEFLFEAARKAQATPGFESPQRRYLSPAIAESPSRTPAAREGDTVFPFEMDTNETRPDDGGAPSFTPFKDRIEAIRPGDPTPGVGSKTLDENERKAKTAALKNYLMSSAKVTDIADNPFNAKPAPQQQQAWHHQRHSNPGTPMHFAYDNNPNQQYFPSQPYGQYVPGSPNQRPPGSNLRNIYAPEPGFNATKVPAYGEPNHARVSTAREQTPVKQPFKGYYTPPKSQSPEQRSTTSAQQIENDLRRVLKLDLTSQG